MNRGKDRNSGTTRGARRSATGAVAAAGVLVVLLAACAQTAPVASADDPPVGSVADVAPENVKVETLPAYRDTVDDARSNGAVWQGSSKKAFARVSACTARLWKKQLPYARLQRQKAGTGQTLQLSSQDDGVLAILDLAPNKPGSQGSLYLGSTGPQSLADAVRQCL
ncbi:hypothetical protein [Pandoraea apista]|uniref:Lipoprotein n=1 Tax=Pandoraea apista TaxID=93218 RepID=A0A0B5FI45_9BURK|nr:hypothetical protein [Pandoraea apista]AJF00412.1 hypothetical protein SG18_23625 [Pandoraea apista]AKH74593.1 hypothetical protein XM39_23805 [Pandoraea apista]AKI63143.1 hypothetical protein AA956_17125 [Pandoraea apista]ALS64819.1 hypothetical protein AT395_07340 [Pandoraea apista]AVF41406.1 hypothetical protein AL486_18170 [Pandoraea apista]